MEIKLTVDYEKKRVFLDFEHSVFEVPAKGEEVVWVVDDFHEPERGEVFAREAPVVVRFVETPFCQHVASPSPLSASKEDPEPAKMLKEELDNRIRGFAHGRQPELRDFLKTQNTPARYAYCYEFVDTDGSLVPLACFAWTAEAASRRDDSEAVPVMLGGAQDPPSPPDPPRGG